MKVIFTVEDDSDMFESKEEELHFLPSPGDVVSVDGKHLHIVHGRVVNYADNTIYVAMSKIEGTDEDKEDRGEVLYS